MNILVINPFNDRSEVALYLGLAEAGIKMEVTCDRTARECKTLMDAGITVSEMPIRHRLDLTAACRLRKKLRQSDYDIIYTTLNKCLSVALLASIGLDIINIAYRGTIGHLNRLDPASWLTYLNPGISKIVCVSEAVRQYLLSLKLPESKLVTIYKGHDPSWYSEMKHPKLSEFDIPDNAFTICFTGNMRPVKGVDVLIESLHHLPKKHNFHLLLVGDVQDQKILELASNPHVRSRIHFTGIRHDAPAIAAACDIFVMPSISREGLPRSVIEAMALGKPTIVTSVGGMPELVVNNESGIVIPPCNPSALAKAISDLADNREKRLMLGQNARNRISTDFNIETTISKMLQLFRDAANTRNKG